VPGHPLAKQHGTVTALAFAPDGKTLATAGKDQKLILWDTTGGKQQRAWTMPAEVRALTFAVDGRHLLAGDADGDICVLRVGPMPKG
jgi:WD40 repeat protein